MAKTFNTQQATDKLFTRGTDNTHDTHNTSDKPRKQPKYRYNLNLDMDLKPFLQKIAWENRTNITQYLNDMIREQKDKYIANGGSLEGWEDE